MQINDKIVELFENVSLKTIETMNLQEIISENHLLAVKLKNEKGKMTLLTIYSQRNSLCCLQVLRTQLSRTVITTPVKTKI